MANELNITYPVAAATIYAAIRRQTDFYAWDNAASAYEVWADGSIGDYDIPLADKSGDIYAADMPTGIAAGNLVITYYLQAGGSPAITDVILGRQWQLWDGDALSDAGAVSLSAFALTDLTKLKRWMHISVTTWDNLLTELINAASNRIERHCGRQFKARDYVDRYSGNHHNRLILQQYPVIELTRMAYGQQNALSVTYSGADIRAAVEVNSDRVIVRSWGSDGTSTDEDAFTFATYASVNALVTGINLVTGWTATEITNVLTKDLNPIGGGMAKNHNGSHTVNLTFPPDDLTEFWVDRDAGIISFKETPYLSGWSPSLSGTLRMPAGFQNIAVEYNAGYATIPDDLDILCREMAQQAFQASQKDVSVTSESLGDYSYSLADQLTFSDAQEKKMARWADIRLA